MGYSTQTGRWADTLDININPAGNALSGTSAIKSAAVEVAQYRTVSLRLLTTALTGTTPHVDVTIETSYDGVTYYSAGTFTQVASTVDATWDQRKEFMVNRFVRASYLPSGTTPVGTIACTGEAA